MMHNHSIYQAALDLAASRRMACAGDIDLLCTVLEDLRERPTVVQLGAGSGTLALGVFGCDFGATLFSFDNKEDGHHWEMAALTNLMVPWGDGRYIGLVADSAKAGELWMAGPVDLIIIDAAHDYESVKRDIVAWKPHVAGFFFMHDYDATQAPNHYPGVKQACDELFADDPVHQKGWSAVFKHHKGVLL